MILADASTWPLLVTALAALSASYLLVAIAGVLAFSRQGRAAPDAPDLVPITVLKPICGHDAQLLDNLRSFCRQDYPAYQVVFGVHDADDPAVPVIEQVIAEHPERDLVLVVDGRVTGANPKVSNLANMVREAKHDIIAIADADIRIERHYLKKLAMAFHDPEVGAATSLYSGSATGGLPSKLGAMFVNDWFLPSALVSNAFRELTFCFGATMAVRRDILRRIGGLQALAPYLADDYMLGRLVSERGAKVRLIPVLVENVIHEASLKGLFLHELRWARTMKSVEPLGYGMAFVTDALPIAILCCALLTAMTGSLAYPAAGLALVLALRVLLHYVVLSALRLNQPATPWLIPLRDCLTFWVRLASFAGQKVSWRGQELSVRAGSRLELDPERNADDEVAVSKPPVL